MAAKKKSYCKQCFLFIKDKEECLNPYHRDKADASNNQIMQCTAKQMLDLLYNKLGSSQECPPDSPPGCLDGSCEECWQEKMYRKFIQYSKSKKKKEVKIEIDHIDPFDIIG